MTFTICELHFPIEIVQILIVVFRSKYRTIIMSILPLIARRQLPIVVHMCQ